MFIPSLMWPIVVYWHLWQTFVWITYTNIDIYSWYLSRVTICLIKSLSASNCQSAVPWFGQSTKLSFGSRWCTSDTIPSQGQSFDSLNWLLLSSVCLPDISKRKLIMEKQALEIISPRFMNSEDLSLVVVPVLLIDPEISPMSLMF